MNNVSANIAINQVYARFEINDSKLFALFSFRITFSGLA